MQDGIAHLQNRQEVEGIQKIVDCFPFLSFGNRHNDVLFRGCEGSGTWLLTSLEASVELRLSNGADVRARDFYDESPLHYIIDSGNLEVLKLPVEAGSYFRCEE